jgi:hypothetical protein
MHFDEGLFSAPRRRLRGAEMREGRRADEYRDQDERTRGDLGGRSHRGRICISLHLAVLVMAALVLAGCSSSSPGPAAPTVEPAKTFRIASFTPAGAIPAEKPAQVSFVIDQPSGQPLTQYRTGTGPHTGVHLIFVRRDLSTIIHRHPAAIPPDGTIRDTIAFGAPGPYRLIVDAYPKLTGPLRNFQLFRNVEVGSGTYVPKPIPPFSATVTVDGYHFEMQAKPKLRAIEAAFLTVSVTDPAGKPATFTPWFGALGHAIFIRAGSLDYFHTHICGPTTPGCSTTLGGPPVVGKSSTPGRLQVGVLLPISGTWRLFLQCKVNGHVLTAPFTLKVT